MSSIQKITGRNRWRVRYREGGRGSPQKASPWVSSKGEAIELKRSLDARLAASRALDGRPHIGLQEAVERWGNRKTKARSARYRSESKATLLRIIGERKWTTIGQVQCRELGIGNFRIVRAFLRYCRDRLEQGVSPKAMLPPEGMAGGRRPAADLLTPERVAELIAEAGKWSEAGAAIAHMVATYGHRPQSLVGLRCDALSGSTLTIVVKSGDMIRHPLLPETVAMLARLTAGRKPDEPMMLNHMEDEHGARRTWATGHEYSVWWHHNVGKGIGIYQLKRFAITRMLAAGLDVATIASITGHRTVNTLLVYARTNEERQKKALAALSAQHSVPNV